jgi:uncharacterized protein
MQYRKFGNTGISISALGFGAMRLPHKKIDGKDVLDIEEGIKTIHRAFELGVNYIDSAPYYCEGESEVVVGKALKGWRDKVFISTKNPIEDDSGVHYRERLEKSLKKLDVEYIDFYHMWGIDWETYEQKICAKDGPLKVALRAKEEGLIKHISFSFHGKPEDMIKLVDTGNFESVLCQYNLLDRSNEAAIKYAADKGLGVVIMGPVGGGRLGAPSEIIRSLMSKDVKSNAEAALRFVLSNPNVSCALSGMENIKMVEENACTAANNAKLNQSEIESINMAMEENKKLAELYCTGCNYCMPCPEEVNIPLNFQMMNYHKVYGITEYAKAEYKKIGTNEWMKGKKAEECIECGLCEDKCPQKLQIRRQLKETATALF